MKQRGAEALGEEFNSSPRVLITLFSQIYIQTDLMSQANILAFLKYRSDMEEEGVRLEERERFIAMSF